MGGLGNGNAQRVSERARCLGRSLNDLYVVYKARRRVDTRADLNINYDIGCHMIMRETHDPRPRGVVPADPRVEHPLRVGDHAFGDEKLRRVGFQAMKLIVRQIIRQLQILSQPAEPSALFVKKVRQSLARLRGISAIIRDKLLGRQLRITAQWFEDAIDVVARDFRASAGRRRNAT